MPLQVHLAGSGLTITATPLTATAFRAFGTVIENPQPELHPSAFSKAFLTSPPFNAISANQGSAIKYQHVTVPLNLYAQAPSGRPGEEVVNMFVCAARALEADPDHGSEIGMRAGGGGPAGLFRVRILERHPFTTQSFIPLGADASRRYLVIVAPSLEPSEADAGLPVPSENLSGRPQLQLPGRGLPDVRNLRAFIATGRQAVTCKSVSSTLF
jgi:ureidoglycolate lyase